MPGLAAVRQVEPRGERGVQHRLCCLPPRSVRPCGSMRTLFAQVSRAFGSLGGMARLDARGGPGQGARMFANPPPEKIARAAAHGAHHRRRRPLGRPHSPESRRGARPAALRLPHHPGDARAPSRSSASRPCRRSVSCRGCLAPASGSTSSTCSAARSTWPGSSRTAFALKLPALWLQDGVIDQAAAERAVRARASSPSWTAACSGTAAALR